MTDITPETVAKMLDGVTEGPWIVGPTSTATPSQFQEIAILSADGCCPAVALELPPETTANARFIAYAREAVPALSAERDALAAKLEEERAERDAFVAKLNTRIAALEADSKAARDAASGSFARAEAAEARNAELGADEVERLRDAISEATHPDFIFGAMDNVNDMDVSLADFADAVSRAQRAALKGDKP